MGFAFLHGWSEVKPPTLSDTGTDQGIRTARARLMPQGVRLVAWIDRRIAEDIDVLRLPQPQGGEQIFIGFPGTLDAKSLQDALRQSNKRVSEATLGNARPT